MALFDTSKGFEACAFYSILEPFLHGTKSWLCMFCFCFIHCPQEGGLSFQFLSWWSQDLKSTMCLAALPCCIIMAMESFHLLHSSHQKVNPVTKSWSLWNMLKTGKMFRGNFLPCLLCLKLLSKVPIYIYSSLLMFFWPCLTLLAGHRYFSDIFAFHAKKSRTLCVISALISVASYI